MKKSIVFLFILLTGLILNHGCVEDVQISPNFKDQFPYSINDYIKNDSLNYYYFYTILKKTGVDKIISSYNPYEDGFTCFLPSNKAIETFIAKSKLFNSFEELLNNSAYLMEFAKYHIIGKSYKSDDFPFGAFNEYTLSGDYLTMAYILSGDSAYYSVNNQAKIKKLNIETSNGYIHLIEEALEPVAFTTYEWIAQQEEVYSIMKKAIDTTGFKNILNRNFKLKEVTGRKFTLLLEPDSVLKKSNIYSIEDLIKRISPSRTDYTNIYNPLYNFVGYHVLDGDYFLNDMLNRATNYITYSDIPIHINGIGMDLRINFNKEILDTIISGNDTTYVNYIGFLYDNSNVITQSGVIHLIDRLNTQMKPTRARQTFEFYEEPVFSEYRQKVSETLIEDSTTLTRIKYNGADLFFIKDAQNSNNAWNNDYLMINGNFSLSYRIPSIVQGEYTIFLHADAYNSTNAVIQIYIDGKKVSRTINLAASPSSSVTASAPFYAYDLGTISFLKYEEHLVEIKSLIPGRFLWDYIQFEPKQ